MPSTHKTARQKTATRSDQLRQLGLGLVGEMTATERASIGADLLPSPKSEAKVERSVLPWDEVKSELSNHPLVKKSKCDPKHVFACLVQLPNVATCPEKQSSDKSDTAPRLRTAAPRSCCCEAETVATSSAHVCTACGAEQGIYHSDELPYRYFAADRETGKHDPNHWQLSRDDASKEDEVVKEVETLQTLAFVHGATHEQTRRASRHFKAYLAALRRSNSQVPNRLAAAAAVLIFAENPELITNRRVGMKEADLPVAPHRCGTCRKTFHVKKDLRYHAAHCRKRMARPVGAPARGPRLLA